MLTDHMSGGIKMAIFYRAAVTVENYNSFRRVLKDAPETFDKWSHERAKDLTHIEGSGGRTIFVEVKRTVPHPTCKVSITSPSRRAGRRNELTYSELVPTLDAAIFAAISATSASSRRTP
jgi:hypothetical protein